MQTELHFDGDHYLIEVSDKGDIDIAIIGNLPEPGSWWSFASLGLDLQRAVILAIVK